MANPFDKIRSAARVASSVAEKTGLRLSGKSARPEPAPSYAPLPSPPSPSPSHIITPEEMTPEELALGRDAQTAHPSLPASTVKKVGLKPSANWHKRNFLTEVLIPSLFTPRTGGPIHPLYPSLKESEIGITWIGHASFLIQTAGGNLLIDPNWAKWLKVIKRIRHPGLPIHHLPAINLVLVTHAHFDHLDRRTLRMVAGDQPIVVPFEVGNLVEDLGFRSVHELGYWQQFDHGPARITLTPCHHWGARFLHDSHRGFGGYIIEIGGRTIYHCGDTAFFPGFKEIGERFNIDVALLPIGAYDPPSGREVHMNPEEAVRAFLDLGAKQMVPMHYGTFRLSYEPPDEPLLRLRAAARQHGVDDRIAVMTEGYPLVF